MVGVVEDISRCTWILNLYGKQTGGFSDVLECRCKMKEGRGDALQDFGLSNWKVRLQSTEGEKATGGHSMGLRKQKSGVRGSVFSEPSTWKNQTGN